MSRIFVWIIGFAVCCWVSPGYSSGVNPTYANTANLSASFNKLFTEWANAFNNKNLAKTCDLFSKNLVFEFQDTPIKNYTQVCNNFKKIFAEKNRRYHYSYQIKQIYTENTLAVIRITWFFKIYEDEKLISDSIEQGVDVFEKEKSGWKILRSVGWVERQRNPTI